MLLPLFGPLALDRCLLPCEFFFSFCTHVKRLREIANSSEILTFSAKPNEGLKPPISFWGDRVGWILCCAVNLFFLPLPPWVPKDPSKSASQLRRSSWARGKNGVPLRSVRRSPSCTFPPYVREHIPPVLQRNGCNPHSFKMHLWLD